MPTRKEAEDTAEKAACEPGEVQQTNTTLGMNTTLLFMMVGTLLYGLAGQIVILLFLRKVSGCTVGWWIGILLALFGAAHMYWSLDRALDLGEKGAAKKLVFHNILRYAVFLGVSAAVMVTGIGNPVACVFGIFGLKAGAYLEPLLEKLYRKAFLKEKEVEPYDTGNSAV
ncbi:MAG: hypothetical protein LUC90_02280 [Lachnospiraceae bacterium]|nr:hypothetical protein [Lachnospiraceae bacterium]